MSTSIGSVQCLGYEIIITVGMNDNGGKGRIADILDVSLDYLTGKTDVEMDKDIQKRILEVSKFNEEDRNNVFSVIDAFIAKRKNQRIM